ncbi:hypothetical protein CU098_012469 [Rhizopus stolonifer]|uniref:Uncharacterized protein n=1 Tax=Rhizopus stolonifer TaxID=4846 RepID=A0A367KKN6_RHIST|nr:hypothetical protein CU098_012469 [Rhizopus stolonifer]
MSNSPAEHTSGIIILDVLFFAFLTAFFICLGLLVVLGTLRVEATIKFTSSSCSGKSKISYFPSSSPSSNMMSLQELEDESDCSTGGEGAGMKVSCLGTTGKKRDLREYVMTGLFRNPSNSGNMIMNQ